MNQIKYLTLIYIIALTAQKRFAMSVRKLFTEIMIKITSAKVLSQNAIDKGQVKVNKLTRQK